MSVLITDAGTKHSLAAIRSLGKKNINIGAIETNKLNAGFFSKYIKKRFVCSYSKDKLFVKYLTKILKKHRYDVFLPIIDTSCGIASKYKIQLEKYTKVPVVDYESMSIALDKKKTLMLAKENDIPIPKTFYPKKISEVKINAKKISYPVVIKTPSGAGSGGVIYVNSEKELISTYPRMVNDINNLPMIQEYVVGKGQGFFALFKNGKPRAIFMHERVREYPITGGPSTMAKSIYSEQLKNEGLKILRALNWHGVAMVEFKLDSRDNKPKLMEVNPKFWGSLDLAIASGVDFPYLAYKMALDGDVKPVMEYKHDINFRWIFPGELLYLLSTKNKLQAFKDFIKFDKNTRCDIDLTDPIPNIFEMILTMHMFISLSLQRKLKYPCGVAKVR